MIYIVFQSYFIHGNNLNHKKLDASCLVIQAQCCTMVYLVVWDCISKNITMMGKTA